MILSPISFNYAFSMLANGADGATRQQITNALGYDAVSIDELNDINKKLTHELGRLDAKVTLNFSNSAWAKSFIQVYSSFSSTLSTYYAADVNKIDDDTFISDINRWCSSKTNGKITDFMQPGQQIPDFALFNAVYFKGPWMSDFKFDVKKTTTGTFNDVDGNGAEAEFMNSVCGMYSKSATMQGCDLAFGNSSFRAMFILPNEGVTISQAMENLANGEWEQLNERRIPGAQVLLSLPKFKIESEIDFMSELAELGMPDISSVHADYSNIAPVELNLGFVKQKATFEINEDGAEASAVTGIGLFEADLGTWERIELTFNRPFIYVVHEHSTRAILFTGSINTFAK
ncbi:MAG: serpin family protein [Barnesiella sp.]|nr:serpin family protein [Barnesiella sp.]